MASSVDLANRFYEAANRRSLDSLRDLVAEDIVFEGPIMRASGANEYLAMNEGLLGFHQATKILKQVEDGDHVCSIYELTMRTPAGTVLTLAISDWLRIQDGKIAEQRIYFDPREFAAAFGFN